jgi:hypothetical protein
MATMADQSQKQPVRQNQPIAQSENQFSVLFNNGKNN